MHQLQPSAVPDTAQLFSPLCVELVALLRRLAPGDWDAQTVAREWRVRDVVSHLLDGELRTLSAHRDGHALPGRDTVHGYADVIALVQKLNAEGVVAGRHWSARILTDLLEVTGAWMSDFIGALDPDAPALFAVAWAGDSVSTNRFDTAREYTERWHHQMQIRLAVGDRGQPTVLLSERYAAPLLETAVQVLPHAFRGASLTDGTTIELTVESDSHLDATGDHQGAIIAKAPWHRTWALQRESGAWRLYAGALAAPTVRVAGSTDAWWRLFFNAAPMNSASRLFVVDGDEGLVAPLWRARSVMV